MKNHILNKMSVPPLSSNEEAFTLLEVLVAIVILSIGLLGMASLTVGIIKGNKFSNNVTAATTLAQEKMEDIRLASEANYTSVVDETAAALSSPNDEYLRGVEVEDDVPAPWMKTVTVTVSWGGASKDEHSVEVKSIIMR